MRVTNNSQVGLEVGAMFCAEDEVNGIFSRDCDMGLLGYSPLQGFGTISRSSTGLRPVLTDVGPAYRPLDLYCVNNHHHYQHEGGPGGG
jgi:hypothetical protein